MPVSSDVTSRVDTSKASSARIYDYFLGGKDNYQVDREAGDAIKQWFPSVTVAARNNRQFMHRATRFLANREAKQFLDIGTGIPTSPNLHQVAQEIAPESRAVYVDNDPLVLAHARALLGGTLEGRTAYIDADLREPETILAAPELRATLDLSAPIVVSMVAVLHFLSDSDAQRAVAAVMDAAAPGSILVACHATNDFLPDAFARVAEVYARGGITFRPRSRAEFTAFFEGLELLEPGIVAPHRWHPHIEPPAWLDGQVCCWAGVARKPHPRSTGSIRRRSDTPPHDEQAGA